MPLLLGVIMRWLHIVSMATLVGGLLYFVRAAATVGAAVAPDARRSFEDKAAASFRPLVIVAVICSIASGLYNLLTSAGHSPRFHMLLGIKLLLAAHVYGVTIVATGPSCEKRGRLMTGALISGLTIVLIAAYLRRIA